MSREIKFRAWDEGDKIMICLSDLKMIQANGRAIHYDDEGGRAVQSGSFVLMQYTGLKDKNGKEIYESDIVKYNTGETWVVKWVSRNASFEYVSNMKGSGLTQTLGSHEVEVVGNAYENPELLK